MRVRGPSTSCSRTVSSPWRNSSAPSEVASSCPGGLRERNPLFFFRKCFFHSLGDTCLTAARCGPSTPPPVGSPRQLRTWARPEVANVIEPLPFPAPRLHQTGTCPEGCGLCGARFVLWIPFLVVCASGRTVSRLRLASPRAEGQGSALPLERRRRSKGTRFSRKIPSTLSRRYPDPSPEISRCALYWHLRARNRLPETQCEPNRRKGCFSRSESPDLLRISRSRQAYHFFAGHSRTEV